MEIFPFLITIFLLRNIRNTIKEYPDLKIWEQRVKVLMTVAVALVLAQVIFDHEHVTRWLWNILLLIFVWVIYNEKVLQPVRSFALTVLPFVAVSLIQMLFNLFVADTHSSWRSYISTARAFAAIWIFANLYSTHRQQKALEKEREKHRQEEELNKVIAARKVELEVLVRERTAELSQQKEELQRALADLRTTQDQLIQSEKLASLGELTAGIAHEIQNPLNFVNNFSEVSIELLEEMEEELEKGAIKEASALSTDIKQNLEKIIYHGKRADGIVKGMLQHSRNNSGERQLTDVNVLADEYLRLSYHGLRAKDKTFNAALTTHFEENLPKINIISQDIGRVLLNLFNNAFYAVQQKQKTVGTDYKPEVTVSTSFTGTFLVIKVKDNGIGIPEEIQDKILQPFFTTKPTGEGTGLGLSLSYDIVVKGHSGKINIESEEGVGSVFLIELPLK